MTSLHQQKIFRQELDTWRWKLKTHPDTASLEIDNIIKGLTKRGGHHYTELARWKAQLLGGVVCPKDFTDTRRPSS